MPFTRIDTNNKAEISCNGATPQEVFIAAAHGLFDVLAHDNKIRGDVRQEIVIQAPDLKSLFREWLAELVSRVEQMGMLYGDFEVFSIQKAGNALVLTGAVYGEPIDSVRHHLQKATLQEDAALCSERGGKATCQFQVSI